MEIKHIHNITAHNTIYEIADNSRVEKNLSNEIYLADTENAFTLPDKERKSQHAKYRQRPNLTLKHTPGAPSVFHIRQIKKA
jgi:hypothetical protein